MVTGNRFRRLCVSLQQYEKSLFEQRLLYKSRIQNIVARVVSSQHGRNKMI